MADRLAEVPQWTNTGETDSSDNSSDLDADPMNAESGDGDQSDTMPDTGSDVGDTSQVGFSIYVRMITLLLFPRAQGLRFHLRKSKTKMLATSC